MNTTAATKTAASRLAKLGRVHALKVTRAGDWLVVDATICTAGFMRGAYATGATLDAALSCLGC